MSEIASAYITLYPKISSTFKQEAERGAGAAMSAAGKKSGDSFGSSFASGASAKAVAVGNIMSSAITGAVGLAASGAKAVIAGAFEGFKDFEQLEGGVSKLFGEGSAGYQKMMQDAQGAFATMGVSANEYMEQATSFSAALISDLSGDTEAAAEAANKAMTSMADNASIFGTDLESVQNAYQGFAKQNYTMLDNLKLGYGGTKTEMERLVADANEYAASMGRASDLSMDSFADIVEAIDLIQQKQGIAGNAANEASKTIEGSINMTKAAWSNLLTELGKEDGDVGARMSELMDSATAVVDNALPRVEKILAGITDALPSLVPRLMEVGGKVASSLADGVFRSLPALVESLLSALTQMADQLAENTDGFVDRAGELVSGIGAAIQKAGPALAGAMGNLALSLAGSLLAHAPQMLEAAGGLMLSLLSGVTELIAPAMGAMDEVCGAMLDAVGGFFASMFDAGANIVQGLIDGIGSAIGGVGDAIMGGLQDAVDGAMSFLGIHSPSKLFTWMGDMSMQGLVDGIEAAADGAAAAARSAVTGMYDAAGGAAASTQGAAVKPASAQAAAAPTVHVTVEARDGEDPYELGRRIGEAASFELKMQGVAA